MTEKTFAFVENGSVTTPSGFRAAGIAVGLKKTGAPDFAVLTSDRPAHFAGAFTNNSFAAAPVRLCRRRVRESGRLSAVVVNSGIANACTGDAGMSDAEETCRLAAAALNVAPESIAVASTGRIGVRLPMNLIADGIRLAAAGLRTDGGNDAARAIMTTDTVPKSAAVRLKIGGRIVSIGAMTKGSGMIDPDLRVLHATMLCFITTDADVDNALLAEMLGDGVAGSFNRITVDGDMSTNDTVLILANGCSGAAVRGGTPEAELFKSALEEVMRDLARRMVADGEGATKFIEVRVSNAATRSDAKLCAEAVANSLLCKTAWFGNDPNWGRVVAALGYSGASFDPSETDVFFDDVPAVLHGGAADAGEARLSEVVRRREFTILVDLHAGDAEYWVWTCDVSHEYVKINADYHT